MSRSLAVLLAVLLIAGFGAYAASTSEQRSSTATEPEDLEPDPQSWAEAQFERLTLEEKVSQMFSAYARDVVADREDPPYERLVDRVERFGVGGIIFFQSNPAAQTKLLNDLQQRTRLPLLVSQDMEWGAGMRVDSATAFPPPMAVGATREPRYAYAIGYATAQEARALGTHHVYAPVADVNNNPENPIINVRSFGERPALVGEMVAAFVRGLQDGGVIATAKHFPGHGDTSVDSHLGLPLLPFKRTRLNEVELVPFRSALDANVMSVMTGHLALPEMEPDPSLPATLSPRVTERLLREELGFQGLVVTDAMNMESVTRKFDPGEAAVRAIEAGTDIILMSEDVYAARAAILDAIRKGRLTEARIDESVRRILSAKEWLGLDRKRLVDTETLRQHVATHAHQALSETVARRSLTLLRNEDNLLPFLADSLRFLTIALTNEKDPEAGDYFAEQLRQHTADSLVTSYTLDRRASPVAYANVRRAADAADVILVPAFIDVRVWGEPIDLSERQRAYLQALTETGNPVVLIAFGNPYVVRSLKEQPAAYLTAYGNREVSQRAAVQALFGRSTLRGQLPITIPGVYAFGAGLKQPRASHVSFLETSKLIEERLADRTIFGLPELLMPSFSH